MKEVILSADGDSIVYLVPDAVADNLEDYCLEFCSNWLRNISLNRFGAITVIDDDKWERLKWTINKKNPGFFQDVIPPYEEQIEQEYQLAVAKEVSKPLTKLRSEAEKKKTQPTVSVVQTKVFNRNPTIAAYVKKRANGICQLCKQKALFIDQYGEPYLECHHIVWLSNGGEDSADNCVALCPNCHRKMHIMNDESDIQVLKQSITDQF